MNNRLYVGNLSYNTGADAVRVAFAEFGAVEDVYMVTDRDTGRPRGFAFVTMSTPEEATKAIEGMDGKMVDGRPLRVNEADQKPRGPRRDFGGGGGGGPGGGGGGYGGGPGGGDRGREGGGGRGRGDRDGGGGRGGRGGRGGGGGGDRW